MVSLSLSDIESFRAKAEPLPVGRTTVEFRAKAASCSREFVSERRSAPRSSIRLCPMGRSALRRVRLPGSPAPGVRGRTVECRISHGLHLEDGRAGGDGPGNAILGAYLNQLVLSEDAILYITYAAPTSVHWMSLEEAAEYGIAVAKLPPTSGSPGANHAVDTERPQGSQEHQQGSPEQRAIDFVHFLFERWSGPECRALARPG